MEPNLSVEEKKIYDDMIALKTEMEEVKNTTTIQDKFWEAKRLIEVADAFFIYLLKKYPNGYNSL